MADSIFVDSANFSALVSYLGQAFAMGLGIAVAMFVMGYGVWFVVDLLRGGI